MPQFATKYDVDSIRKELHAHNKDDLAFQERMFDYLKDEFADVGAQFSKLNGKIETMWDERNFRMGAEAGSERTEGSYDKKKTASEKVWIVAGWTFNACLAAITAFVTVKTGIR